MPPVRDQIQNIQHVANLDRIDQRFTAAGNARDSGVAQNRRDLARVDLRRAEQDDDVGLGDRPQDHAAVGVTLRNPRIGGQHFTNAPGRQPCLALDPLQSDFVVRAFFCLIRIASRSLGLQNMHLDPALAVERRVGYVIAPSAKRLALPVFAAPQTRVEQHPKHSVKTRQQTLVAAKVVGQVNRAAREFAAVEFPQLLGEQPRIGLPKPVDALLHVANHEAVRLDAVGRDQLQHRRLHRAGVLIFVNQNVSVAPAKHSRDGRRLQRARFVRPAEQIERHPLDV